MPPVFSLFRPRKELLPFIDCYWFATFNEQKAERIEHTVCPNGSIELIFHLNDHSCMLKKGGMFQNSPSLLIVGFQTEAYNVAFKDSVDVFGIRFHPDGLKAVLNLESSEIISTHFGALDVLGHKLTDLYEQIVQSLNRSKTIELTDDFLYQSMIKNHYHDDYFFQSMRFIRSRNGLLRLDELHDRIAISPRQLQRKFREIVGVSAKEYIEIVRLSHIQQKLNKVTVANLRAITYDANFSDQAHFTRSFKRRIHTTPSSFIKSRHNYLLNPLQE